MLDTNKNARPKNELTGKRFVKLLVLEYVGAVKNKNGKNDFLWKCVCDCGNEIIASGHNLARGHRKSCGCLHEMQMEKYKTVNYKHGRTISNADRKAYSVWEQIKKRCYNKENVSYKYYGAKGIKLAPEWEHDPDAFCRYVEKLENYGKQGMTIDRIDPRGNYEPGNLRWLSLADQQKNRTNNYYIEFKGKKLTITEWGRETGIDRRTIQARLRLGWSVDDALTIIPKIGGHYNDQREGV